MASIIPVDDPLDPRLDDFRHVRDRDMRGEAGRPGLFIGEQALIVEKMLAIPGVTKAVMVAPTWMERIVPRVLDETPIYVASLDVMARVAGFPIHRGVLAVGYRPSPARLTLDAVLPKGDGPLTVLVVEGVTNIDNIGGLFRAGAAFGVDAVVLDPTCHDPLYRKAVRVSIGHVLSVPWARSVAWEHDLSRLRSEWGITLVGAATGTGAVSLDEVKRPRRVGLVVGPEYAGLSARTRTQCDVLARIPMASGVDSLNVTVAAAVCLHSLTHGVRA